MFNANSLSEAVDESTDLEEVVMELIINAGQARSLAYAALKQAKEGKFEQAQALMASSRLALNEAHHVQTQLIEEDQGSGKTRVSLVLVHAQDHLMTAMLARELVTELIELHEKIK